PETPPPGRPQQPRKHGDAQGAKPVRLIHRGRDGEIQHRARLVPHAIVVRRRDVKPVVTRREIRIAYRALVDDISPTWILPFQSEPEADLFRRRQAEGGVVDAELADLGR